MRTKLLAEAHGVRTFMLVFAIGEEVASGIKRFAQENKLKGSHFTALGAFEQATLGWWNWASKKYEPIHFHEQVELLSLIGNVARAPGGDVTVHAHAVIAKRDGSAHGGHLLEARVRPVLEVTLIESPEHLQRQPDVITGLALLVP